MSVKQEIKEETQHEEIQPSAFALQLCWQAFLTQSFNLLNALDASQIKAEPSQEEDEKNESSPPGREKTNACSWLGCSKSFSRKDNLKVHLRCHTGEKPYSCELAECGKAFSSSSDLTKHLQRTHSDEKGFICTFRDCNSRYKDPSSLRKHVTKKHGKEEYEKMKREGNTRAKKQLYSKI